jgi:hypothetical protein
MRVHSHATDELSLENKAPNPTNSATRGYSLTAFFVPNVEFIVMPSKLGETNLGADCGGFYSAFYRSEARKLTARLGFECRDGLARRNRFL